jgi:hypothetical protein
LQGIQTPERSGEITGYDPSFSRTLLKHLY